MSPPPFPGFSGSSSPVPPHPFHPPLAGGTAGPRALRPLLDTVVDALAEGAAARGGPLPPGGPDTVAERLTERCGPVLPEVGGGAEEALRTLVHALAEGAADPADPLCAAHLHCPPLAVAAVADFAASVLNPSMDSWDQAPAASALEARTARVLAALVHPTGPAPDALVTTGGTEANQIAVLLARERTAGPAGGTPLRVVHGANAHHSVPRAAWLLGLPPAVPVPTPRGVIDPAELARALDGTAGEPTLVVATAGTTDTGAVDPLPAIADLAAARGARFHVDAAYGGPLLFSDTHRGLLGGVERADTVALDLHKLGWQPAAAGLLTAPDAADLAALHHRAPYLNAEDDTEAGLPDLLGRSLRTTRRPDILKIAVTLRALGRSGLAALVDATCAAAGRLAGQVLAEPRLDLYAEPTISTVLFRPVGARDEEVAVIRRRLLNEGTAVLGRARVPDRDGSGTERLWLKATVLNPLAGADATAGLLKLVLDTCGALGIPADPTLPAPRREGNAR
ncbi:aminotransferase class V-fold PLP-dependent enzyme [Streptomyces sp. ST2-7A]|uniref:pyridoxal phosphate-dependent decarboxylase family protein n=1 Tax=Streptomyces sp. ST2-7A TaxID=2907214 RepID=UPI001F3B7182|nr:aminotransferase class V-fold PLP-dependent enzyme [Streptomyces sp. ST2-7A]MCE7081926.1 aminotransferase class V-fold PLP-dependent enzyme [Streptomyces sp. ST2-7A]